MFNENTNKEPEDQVRHSELEQDANQHHGEKYPTDISPQEQSIAPHPENFQQNAHPNIDSGSLNPASSNPVWSQTGGLPPPQVGDAALPPPFYQTPNGGTQLPTSSQSPPLNPQIDPSSQQQPAPAQTWPQPHSQMPPTQMRMASTNNGNTGVTPSRPWFKKKRWIGGMAFVGLAAVSGLADSGDEIGSQPDELAFAETDTTIDTGPTTAAPKPETTASDSVASDITTPTSSPTETTVEEVVAEVNDVEARRLAFHLLVRSEFPLIDLAVDSDPAILESMDNAAIALCGSAKESENQEQFTIGLALVWAQQEDTTKVFFNGELEEFAKFAGYSMATFCPGEFERLGQG